MEPTEHKKIQDAVEWFEERDIENNMNEIAKVIILDDNYRPAYTWLRSKENLHMKEALELARKKEFSFNNFGYVGYKPAVEFYEYMIRNGVNARLIIDISYASSPSLGFYGAVVY